MTYKCLRCGKSGEYRKGTKTGKNKTRYSDLELEMKKSRIAHLHKPHSERNLCLPCLEELWGWLNVKHVN